MVIFKTKLRVADNSGAQICQCIHIYGGLNRRRACLGDTILVAIKNLKHRKKVDKKKVYYGLIVSSTIKTMRIDGSFIKYDFNKILLINLQNKFLGSRIYSPLCREIRGGKNEIKYKQLLSYSRSSL
jgi:large subunit ribosomal protein L14